MTAAMASEEANAAMVSSVLVRGDVIVLQIRYRVDIEDCI